MTVRQYRNMDLTMLAVILAVTQVLIHYAASVWYSDQLYVVSPVAIVTALVMMRWGPWSGIHAVLGGVVFTAAAGGSVQQYLIYGIGNLFSMLALLMIHLMGKDKIRENVVFSLGFGALVQLLMLLGRAAVAAVLGYGWSACLSFIMTDLLSVLLTLCAMLAVRRMDGLFEDQIQYLLRLQSEQSTEGREQL